MDWVGFLSMQLCLRVGFIVVLLLCNVLYFLDVEPQTERLLAFAFGRSEPAPARAGQPVLTKLQMREKRSYGFSNPARAESAPR